MKRSSAVATFSEVESFRPLRSVEDIETIIVRISKLKNDGFRPLRSVEDIETFDSAQSVSGFISFRPLRSVEDIETIIRGYMRLMENLL